VFFCKQPHLTSVYSAASDCHYVGILTPALYVRFPSTVHEQRINQYPVQQHMVCTKHAVRRLTTSILLVLIKRCRISSRTSYDNTMHTYNVTRILTPELTLDRQAYLDYSPLFLS
jgi:hypothetical protein